MYGSYMYTCTWSCSYIIHTRFIHCSHTYVWFILGSCLIHNWFILGSYFQEAITRVTPAWNVAVRGTITINRVRTRTVNVITLSAETTTSDSVSPSTSKESDFEKLKVTKEKVIFWRIVDFLEPNEVYYIIGNGIIHTLWFVQCGTLVVHTLSSTTRIWLYWASRWCDGNDSIKELIHHWMVSTVIKW